MKTYLLYIMGFVALMAVLAISIHAHLIWPSIALVVMLLWLCVSLYGRVGRLLYAYHEMEKTGNLDAIFGGQDTDYIEVSQDYIKKVLQKG